MKKTGIIALAVGLCTSLFAQENLSLHSHFWGEIVGTPNLVVDSSGNLLAGVNYLGEFYVNNSPVTGGDSTEAIVLKFGQQQELLWQKSISGSGDIHLISLELGEQNSMFIQGTFNPALIIDNFEINNQGFDESFVCKLDSNGNALWLQRGMNNIDTLLISQIKAGYSGEYYASGYKQVSGTNYFDYNEEEKCFDSFIAKYSSSGEREWFYDFNFRKDWVSDLGGISCIDVDSKGNCYWVGAYKDSIKVEDVVLTGNSYNHFYGMLNSDGTFQWVKNITANQNNAHDIRTIQVLNNQSLYLHGEAEGALYFPESVDMGVYSGFFTQHTTSGKLNWGTSLEHRVNCSFTCSQEYTFYAGYKYGYGDMNGFGIIDPEGVSLGYDTIAAINVLGFAQDNNGDVIIVASLLSDLELGRTTVSPKDGNNTITLRLESEFFLTEEQEVAESNRELRVYPNPAQGEIHFDGGVESYFAVSLFDMEGRVWRQLKASNSKKLDVSGLPAGIYVLQLSDGKGIKIARVVLY